MRQVSAGGRDEAAKGILRRADLHKLFDANLIAIDPATGKVEISEDVGKDYRALLARAVFVPPPGGPKLGDFKQRWTKFSEV